MPLFKPLLHPLWQQIKNLKAGSTDKSRSDRSGKDTRGTTCSFNELLRLEDMAHMLLAERSAKFPQGLSGDFLSAFRGHGMEYHESRLYQYGDDVRNMDWRVTARTHKPFVKTYRDEREHPVFFLVDHSNSMHFATRNEYKAVNASKIATLIAWAAASYNDKVGGLVFDNHSHYEIQPSLGDKGVLKLIRKLAIEAPAGERSFAFNTDNNPSGEGASLLDSLRRLKFLIRRGSRVFIISDFNSMDSANNLVESFDKTFFELSRRGEINLIIISDPIECSPLPQGQYRLSDGQNILAMNHVNQQSRNKIAELFQQRTNCLNHIAKKYGLKMINVSTEDELKTIAQRQLLHLY